MIGGKMVKTTNAKCRYYAQNLIPFEASNLFGEDGRRYYVVFSYGRHFPLYAYDKQTHKWYENKDGYSHTTSVHRSKARPTSNTVKIPTRELQMRIGGFW